MDGQRTERVGEAIKEEVSEIIARDLKDPRVGFVTVTGVDVSADLRHATVYVTVLGNEEKRRRTLEALQKASGFIQADLGKRIRLKYLPQLRFEYDTSVETGFRIDDLIKKVHKEEE